MIKTIVTPKTNQYKIELPLKYVGKKIEILVYAVDELINENKQTTDTRLSRKYRGILNKEQGTELNNHINQMRNEWNNIKNT